MRQLSATFPGGGPDDAARQKRHPEAVSTWTCRRQTEGVICGQVNQGKFRKCITCQKPRPARKRPAHMAALDLPYEHFVQINGGEFCGICGAERKPEKRLDRDHDHRTGLPRGLLCWSCNRQLRTWSTVEWLLAAAAYLQRHLERTRHEAEDQTAET